MEKKKIALTALIVTSFITKMNNDEGGTVKGGTWQSYTGKFDCPADTNNCPNGTDAPGLCLFTNGVINGHWC